ncbi:hypothetical protein ACFE04_000142 [Oxalis oulophora]
MYKSRIGDHRMGYAETDPSGRYGRFKEVLGKGAMKTVYRAFDEILGMEVAWNQVKLQEVFHSADEIQRLYSEVHLLNNLSHDSIMKFYASWIDIERRTFNFISEMFTSGTLREYRLRYPRVDLRAIKNWARQILHGLVYLHNHDPPIIHRDLKCDNIFINGHLGQVKIGDLGLAAILQESQIAHSVIGTPEFMAPELYEEEYNELIDIYSFGMCMLQMLTAEYPYSECSNPAQIYKKVTSRKLPKAFYRIHNQKAQEFIGNCLVDVSKRMSAKELLCHPFIASDEGELLPVPERNQKLLPNGMKKVITPYLEVDRTRRTTYMTITGTLNPEDDAIFLRVKLTDKNGHTRNIYFPFDVVNDTAIGVAMEMVKELEINDLEPMKIAEMIEEEILSLIPAWIETTSPKLHQHHNFVYSDDDVEEGEDGKINRPYYCASSHFSHASLPGLRSHDTDQSHHHNDLNLDHDWLKYNHYSSDDASSSHSYAKEDYDSSFKGANQNFKSTRFSPETSLMRSHQSNPCCPIQPNCHRCCGSNQPGKINKVRSLLDIRSQMLHRSLVEEINKRRLFKTVTRMENIGFQEPACDF